MFPCSFTREFFLTHAINRTTRVKMVTILLIRYYTIAVQVGFIKLHNRQQGLKFPFLDTLINSWYSKHLKYFTNFLDVIHYFTISHIFHQFLVKLISYQLFICQSSMVSSRNCHFNSCLSIFLLIIVLLIYGISL